MKICRVFIDVGGQKFFFDVDYDKEKTDAQNCDAVLTLIVEQCQHNVILKVMTGAVANEESRPAVLNLGQVGLLVIDNVAVYQTKE